MTTKPSLTRDELHALLWDLAAEYLGPDREQLTPQMRLSHDLGADSLAVTELALAVEERLGVTIPDEALDRADLTLGQVEEALWAQCRAG